MILFKRFRAFGSFLDGGLIANNPTLDALTEIQEYNSVINALGAGTTIQPKLVVSLGTGCKPTEAVISNMLFELAFENLIQFSLITGGYA